MPLPVDIGDLLALAQALKHHIEVAEENKESFKALAGTVTRVTGSLNKLQALAGQESFIEHLDALKEHLTEINAFFSKRAEKAKRFGGEAMLWVKAGKYADKIEGFEQKLVRLESSLSVALHAAELKELKDLTEQRKEQNEYLRELGQNQLTRSGIVNIFRKEFTAFQTASEQPQSTPPVVSKPPSFFKTSVVEQPHPPRPGSPTGEVLYQQGLDAQRSGDMPKAYDLFLRSSQQGFAKGYTNVGLFKLDGLGGQTINKAGAKAYLEQGALNGHARAMYSLGVLYEKDHNYTAALKWYEQAKAKTPNDPNVCQRVELMRAKSDTSGALSFGNF